LITAATTTTTTTTTSSSTSYSTSYSQNSIQNIHAMSDDEMDIDEGGVTSSITFSTAATESKGKRSAANLPVEAGDTLPW